MGRLEKSGLDFFPLQTDFFQDTKIRLLTARFGVEGQLIIIRLFCEIYRYQGYYLKWDEDTALLLAAELGNTFTREILSSVLNESFKRGLFDKNIFDHFGVLTSKGIQERYYKICRDAKRKHYKIDPDYCLIDINSGNTPEEMELTPEETQKTQEFSTQSKGKETKEYKTESKSSCSRGSSVAEQGNLIFNDSGQTAGNHFLIPPEEQFQEEELTETITSLFRKYCNKTPHYKETEGVIQILRKRDLPLQGAWICVMESFGEYPLLDRRKQNTKYLLGMVRGKISDVLLQEREAIAARRKEQVQWPAQHWDPNGPSPIRDWLKDQKPS